MYNDKSDSNWDKLRKCHNEAKRQRQRAIKSCWRDKSNHLKENPADFYRTFMPFLSSKASKKSSQLNLKVGEESHLLYIKYNIGNKCAQFVQIYNNDPCSIISMSF